jgi:copper resistance protein B
MLLSSAPALAQHEGHGDHTPSAPSAEPPAQVHQHDHAAPAPEPADPHAGHAAPQSQLDPPVAPPDAAANSGPEHAADLFFDPAAMARSRAVMQAEHGAIRSSKLLIDRLETHIRDGKDGYAWNAQFRWGGDRDKLWLKSEGEATFGEKLDAVEVQALWSHAIDPWFDVQLGVRHDFWSGVDRSYAVLGVQGLAPYWFELDAALFLSDKGDVTARAEAEYDLRITPALILQPRAELNVAFQDVAPLGIGSGLSTAALGSRLRYEIAPQFAPYVGVEWERRFGDTRRLARAAGEDAGGWSLILGVRAWF